jgi:hypothetical protein
MQDRSFEGYEMDACNVQNIIDAFRLFPEAGLKPLVKRGMGSLNAQGKIVVVPSGWVSLANWLGALDEILQSVGPSKMYEIGKQIPKNAVFPPNIVDVVSALGSVDVAYHMNHRKNGVVMFDPATGAMLDGIGHYSPTLKPQARHALVECDNPYPCDLDRGVLVALALRFERNARIEHLEESRCRKHGATKCVYKISW